MASGRLRVVFSRPRLLRICAVLVVAGLFNLGYWYRLDSQSKSIAQHMKVAEQKNRELADVKARFLERQTQANNYKRRVDVIDGLRAGQSSGPAPSLPRALLAGLLNLCRGSAQISV